MRPDGNLFVSTYSHHVKVFIEKMTISIRSIGGQSFDENSKFNNPTGVTFDRKAQLVCLFVCLMNEITNEFQYLIEI